MRGATLRIPGNYWARVLLLACCALSVVACSQPEPIRIALLAGLSDRGSDFGESVRNGVILAIEQKNAAGGIHGRRIELIVRDDGQDAAQARIAAQELIDLRPEIVIGPVTSSMAAVVVPMMDQAGLVTISPTVASTRFFGLDDHFFRVNCTTAEAAIAHAGVLYARGLRRAALAYDQSNLPFSGTWIEVFSKEFERLGGQTAGTSGFASAAETRFADVIRDLLRHQPDALVFVASTLDTSRLAQQARRLAPDLHRSSSEWAASGEALSEMGGRAVDGLLMMHAYDRNDTRPAYRRFVEDFRARFLREYGSFSLLAYDTANVVMTALERKLPGETMKQALLAHGPYLGVQQTIQFNETGDATRDVFFTEIRSGQFHQVR